MKKLISLILSFSLLFTSITPLQAGIPPTGIKSIVSSSRLWARTIQPYVVTRFTTLPVQLSTLTAAQTLRFTRVQAATALQQITNTQLPPKTKQQLYLDVIPALVVSSHTPITVTQHKNTLSFYRSLAKENQNKSLFPLCPETLDMWGQNMALISNLGFMGTPDDVTTILALGEKSPILLDVFTDITVVRALLNLGSLDGVAKFAQLRAEQHRLNTAIWQDIQQFINESQLEITLPEINPENLIPTQQAAQRAAAALPALNKWNSLNHLQQNSSPENTLDWLALKLHQGTLTRDPEPSALAAAQKEPAEIPAETSLPETTLSSSLSELQVGTQSLPSLEVAPLNPFESEKSINSLDALPAEDTPVLESAPQKQSVFTNSLASFGNILKKGLSRAGNSISSFVGTAAPILPLAASGAVTALVPEENPVLTFMITTALLTPPLAAFNYLFSKKALHKVRTSVKVTTGLSAVATALNVYFLGDIAPAQADTLQFSLFVSFLAGQLILNPVLAEQIHNTSWLRRLFMDEEEKTSPGFLSRTWAKTQHFLFKAVHPHWHAYLKNLFLNNPQAVSKQLAARKERSITNMTRLHHDLPFTVNSVFWSHPSAFTSLQEIPLKWLPSFYPTMENILTTAQQFTDYFTIQNNRQAALETQTNYNYAVTLNASIERLKQHQHDTRHPGKSDARWLAEQIPQDTQYLLLGERHEFAPIQQTITQLIEQLPKRFPGRKIILVTEFLPQRVLYDLDLMSMIHSVTSEHRYMDIWTTGLLNSIATVGLEPDFAASAPMQANLPGGIRKEVLLATTSEGMRLRNQIWKADIEEYRKEFPDALFVIHSGFGHIDYTLPHSLGRAFQNDKTFVISFQPGIEKKPSIFKPISTFDIITNGEFPQRILQFDKEDAPITGFDIQFKVSKSQSKPSRDNDVDSIFEVLLEIFSH